MDRRWWALPLAMTTLVAGACGAGGPTAGGGSASTASPSPTSAVPSSVTSSVPSSAPSSVTPGQCPPGGTGRGYAISLASTGVVGAESPEAAANSTRFGVQPDWAFGSTTWTTTSAGPQVVWLAQDEGSVEVFRLPDGSWYVTTVTRCD